MKELYKFYVARERNSRGKYDYAVREKNSDIKLKLLPVDAQIMKDWMLFLVPFYKAFRDDGKLFSRTEMSEYLLIEGNVESIDDGVISMLCDSSFNYAHQIESQFMPVEFTPKGQQTASQCLNAVMQNGLSLAHMSKRFLTESLCLSAIQQNWRSLQYIPCELISTELAIEAIKQNKRSVQYIPIKIRDRKDVVKAMQKYGVINITFNGYQKKSNTFLIKGVSYIKPDSPEEIYKKFDSFDEFYHYPYVDLLKAELSDYDFAGIDLTAYNFDDIVIPVGVLEKVGMYDDSFYDANVRIYSEELKFKPSRKNKLIEVKSALVAEGEFDPNNKVVRFYYISDIHLYEKIKKKFPERATKKEITCYIREIAKKLVHSIDINESYSTDKYLLVAGDVSFNYYFTKIFYEELARQWEHPNKIIAILGNHELWLGSELKRRTLESIVSEYRCMFEDLGISFLHNELLIKKREGLVKITERELSELTEKELETECIDGQIVILGGTGFSAYNKKYNATSGLYRFTMSTLGEDMEQTARFGHIYTKVENAVNKKKVIVLTHMLKEDWLPGEFSNNWIYVSGHTHKNTLIVNNDVTLYADNQVGYSNTRFGFKSFSLSINYDIFLFYKDGIYDITREQYSEFYQGLGILMQLNRKDFRIYMLKRKGIYCFLANRYNHEGLYLLNGGSPRTLYYSDINYYFNNLERYAVQLFNKMKKPNLVLEQIAKEVKTFGGEGHIHGCIVDIDFFNHIYLNPYDGKIIPYYATSIVDKYVYSDLAAMLSEQCPRLYANYMGLIERQSNELMIFKSTDIVKQHEVHHVEETDIYKASRVIRALQYTTENNIIRTWDENLLNSISDEDILSLEQQDDIILRL